MEQIHHGDTENTEEERERAQATMLFSVPFVSPW